MEKPHIFAVLGTFSAWGTPGYQLADLFEDRSLPSVGFELVQDMHDIFEVEVAAVEARSTPDTYSRAPPGSPIFRAGSGRLGSDSRGVWPT